MNDSSFKWITFFIAAIPKHELDILGIVLFLKLGNAKAQKLRSIAIWRHEMKQVRQWQFRLAETSPSYYNKKKHQIALSDACPFAKNWYRGWIRVLLKSLKSKRAKLEQKTGFIWISPEFAVYRIVAASAVSINFSNLKRRQNLVIALNSMQ